MSDTVRAQLVITENQDDWLNELKEKHDNVNRSFIVRRALKYYKDEGVKRDKIMKKKIDGEL